MKSYWRSFSKFSKVCVSREFCNKVLKRCGRCKIKHVAIVNANTALGVRKVLSIFITMNVPSSPLDVVQYYLGDIPTFSSFRKSHGSIVRTISCELGNNIPPSFPNDTHHYPHDVSTFSTYRKVESYGRYSSNL